MTQIEVQELESHPDEVVRRVKRGETVQLMEDGRIIAEIRPNKPGKASPLQDAQAFLDDLDRLAEEVGQYWPEGVSAVDAVRDVRA